MAAMHEQAVRAAVFDLDGTLLDTMASLHLSSNETLKELGLPPLDRSTIMSFVGMGSRVLVDRLMAASGIEDPKVIERAHRIYSQVFPGHSTHEVIPFEGIRPMLEQLADLGLKLGIVTNKNDRLVPGVVASSFPPGLFAAVRGARRMVPLKPHPRMVEAVLKKMGADPERSFFIGDSDVDVLTGQAAGMYTIAVTWGFRSRDLLTALGPDCLADTPAQVVECIRRQLQA